MITHNSIGYSGRLGNQMFQYAALKVISILMKDSIVLPNHTKIKEHGCFDYTNEKWIPYKLDLLDGFDLTCKLGYIPINSDSIVLDGYYQSYLHMTGYESQIINEFVFKHDILVKSVDKIKQYKNPVAIHVRRGDYVKNTNS